MKSIRDIGSTKNKLRYKVIMFSLALGLLVVVSTNAISPLELVKPAMAAKKLISTDDIADNAVTSPKIKDGEVKTSDIEDGTITSDDVSPTLMIKKTLNDDIAGHSHGWNPDSDDDAFGIVDNDVSPTKFVQLITDGSSNCQITKVFSGAFTLECSPPFPAEGTPLRYIIINPPEQVVTSSASATETSSSTSSSTPTISSPFSSLGGH